MNKCPDCRGSGRDNVPYGEKCETCNGSGCKMTLNERAAACMGWHDDGDEFWSLPNGDPADYLVRAIHGWEDAEEWNPERDYNHARMLYERVVERGLEDDLAWRVTRCKGSSGSAAGYVVDSVLAVLRLTAAQLTEACCEVLESNDE